MAKKALQTPPPLPKAARKTKAKAKRPARRRIVTGARKTVSGLGDDFNLDNYQLKRVAALLKKAMVPSFPEYVPMAYDVPKYIGHLQKWCKQMRGRSTQHTEATLNDFARMLFYDLASLMHQTSTTPLVAYNMLRRTGVALAHSTASYGMLGKFTMTGAITVDSRGPVGYERGMQVQAYFTGVVCRVFIGYRLVSQMEALWAIMYLADEIRDIYQEARVQASYKKGVLSTVDMGEFGD